MERIGLVAGGGALPVIFAKEARKKKAKVIGFAIRNVASPELEKVCDKIHWLGINQIKKFAFLLLVERIKKIALLGTVEKAIIYGSVKNDKEAGKIIKETNDKNDYSILSRITAEFEKKGVEVISGIEYLSDLLPSKGVLTEKSPSEKEYDDIDFGFKMAKELARADVGQTVVVKDRAVVTVEGMEGTDRTIERAGKLCGEGFVVTKVSRPDQDMRWDVPTVGLHTMTVLAENSFSALAIESDRTFLLDREKFVEMAEKSNIAVKVL